MTQIVHLTCDRCGKDVAHDPRNKLRRELNWAQVHVAFQSLDFCSTCWAEMLKLAKVELPVED